MTPEGKVKKTVKEFLISLGFQPAAAKPIKGKVVGWFYMPVSNGMGIHGIPDFVCVYKGLAFYIEVKADEKSEPTANQLLRHKEIRAAGGMCIVAYNVSQVADAIYRMDKEINGRTPI